MHFKILETLFIFIEIVYLILETSKFKDVPLEQILGRGGDGLVICEPADEVTVAVRWRKDDVIISGDGEKYVMNRTGLIIKNVDFGDSGNYTCDLQISSSHDLREIQVIIHVPPSILSFPNISAKENQSISITCLFEGIPTPSVVITKTGSSLRIEEETLNISSLSLSDHGTYVCEVQSEFGRDLKEAEINVLFKPRATSDQIYEWFNFALHAKNATCSVIANPPPSFTWLFNDVELTSSNSTFTIFHGLYESHLQMYIETIDQAWIYSYDYRHPSKISCWANNSVGNIYIDMTFLRTTISDTLYNLTYIAYPCQIDFNYSLPEDTGGEPVTGLVAYLNETPRELPLKKMIRINKLEATTFYNVYVACVTFAGHGDYVDEFEITTTAPSKPYPVELLSAVNTSEIAECPTDVIDMIDPGDCSVCVKWDEPIDVCIPIQNYRIRYRLVIHDPNTGITSPIEDWVTHSDYNGAELSITLKNLRCNSGYEFEMFAKNDLGESKSSGMLFFQTSKSYDLVILPDSPVLEKEYGDDVFLRCKLNNPSDDIKIVWFDNAGNEITATSQRVNESSVWVSYQDAETHLFISGLVNQYTGHFTCVVKVNNDIKKQICKEVRIIVPPSILSFLNITEEENQPISIECLFEGVPTPSVVITKTGSSLRIEENILRISRLDLSDHGTYVCEVQSEFGRDLKEAEINVLFKPRATSDQIYEWFNFARHAKNITCSVIANPPPSFAWFYNDVELTTSNSTFTIFHGVYESHLQMYIEMRDQDWIFTSGENNSPSQITCKATNSIGSVDIDMSLRKAVKPNTLYNLTYIAYPCQIDFNYSLPEDTGGEPVTGLVAYLNETPRELPLKKIIRINKLRASTHYTVSLAYITVAGHGDYVDEFEIMTTSPSKLYPVELLSAVNTSKTAECTTDVIDIIDPGDCSVCVKWDEPIDVCIPIQNYRIRYRLVIHDPNTGITSPIEDWVTHSDYNGAELSITLKSLRCNSGYEFEMFAKNDLGESKSSGILFFQTYDLKEELPDTSSCEETRFVQFMLSLTELFVALLFI